MVNQDYEMNESVLFHNLLIITYIQSIYTVLQCRWQEIQNHSCEEQ